MRDAGQKLIQTGELKGINCALIYACRCMRNTNIPKEDGLRCSPQARSGPGGQGADRGVVPQLQCEIGLVDNPVGTEDGHLSGPAGKVHLHKILAVR